MRNRWKFKAIVLSTIAVIVTAVAPGPVAASASDGDGLAFVTTMRPMIGAAGDQAKAAAALQEDPVDLRAECELRKPQASATLEGWLRDRMMACKTGSLTTTAIDLRTGKEAGHADYDLWVLGFANHGVRQVDYLVSVENIEFKVEAGYVIDWPLTTLQFSIQGCPGSPTVSCADQTGLSDVFANWLLRPSRGLTYTSDPATGAGAELVVPMGLTMTVQVIPAPGDEIIPGLPTSVFESRVRFDSAGQVVVGRNYGSVFTSALLIYRLWLSSDTHPKSALHIYDALHRPERTFPSWVGKSVPGGNANEPLHRLTDSGKIDENRAVSIATCKDIWGPDYATGGLECDEFPFASTYEGAKYGTEANGGFKRYSVRPIPAADNNDGGGNRLKDFYWQNRILDSEAFYVDIIP
ncbi:NucA/NucB deoxyribonuclease domain-containing protein [Actinoplanes sp. NPDC026619]|uniref:NucA/NucB deoxyribonuclease domain-containing protein n=1 Tax=Actinoplanes sp. NPDC026619 TaxID=3155798 RepID=UPI0033CD6C75